MKRHPKSWRPALRWTLPASVLLFLTGCAKNAPQDTLDPQGPVARQIDQLQKPVFIVAGIVFVIVQTLVLVAAFKFRAREGGREPKQVHGNTRLEVGWTLIPALILFAIAIPTIKTIFDLSRKPPGALNVTVIGHQFWWEYRYDDLGITTANELVIPVGQPVEMRLQSVDVIHSFWIPPLGGKQDVVPGRENHMSFEAEKPGRYLGQCGEFCGLSHANMRAVAVAKARPDFDAWVQSQRAPAAEPAAGGPAAAGLAVYNQKGCGGCHTVAGVSVGKVGPDLTHFASREVFAGAMFNREPSELRPWLRNPPGVKPGALMPNLGLSPQEINDLVAYLESLR